MDNFSRGLLIPEEKQKQQNQNRPWIPITPSKPIPRAELVSVYTEGNQLGGATNYLRQAMFDQGFFSEIPNSNGMVENFNSVSSVDHRDFLSNNWEAAAALGSSNNRGDLGSDKTVWNNLACSDLLALAEAASGASKASASGSDRGNNNAASTSSVPGSCSQIPTNLQQPDLASMLFQNQNISVSSSMPNNNSPLQLPHYGYPGSYIPSYDLNSLPNLNDTLLDGLMSYQFEPFTPDHSKRLKKSIHVPETVNACLDEQIIQENNKQQEVGHNGSVVPELISNQPTSAPVDPSNAGLSTQMNKNFEADKGGDNGIDLNTPPQRQKPKRKKYTPKVVREGKPKSTPKPKTPKQASTTENPTGRRKRKYVRKTGPKASENPSVECVKDTVNSTSESAARSCKRSFNFDSNSQARDESHGTILDLQKHLPSWNVNRSSYMWDFNSNSGIQAKDMQTGDNSGSPTKSLLQGTQGWEVIVENSRAQTAFDLNHYSTQKQCISLPEQSSSELSQPTETELRREYLKVHSREINVTRTADECVSSAEIGCPPISQQIHTEEVGCIALPTKTAHHGLQSMPTRPTDSSNGSNGTEQARGSKREYCNVSNTSQLRSLNLLGAQFNSLQAYHEIFQKIHKKKRTEKVHNTVASSLLSPNKSNDVGSNGRQTMSRRMSDPNSIYFASQMKCPQSAPRSNNTIGTTYIRNNISNCGSNLRPHSMPVGHNAQVQNSSAVVSHVEALRGATLDKLPEFMLSNGETGWRTKRRSKGSTWARNSASLSALFPCNKMPSTPPKTEQKQANGQQVQISDGPLACIQALAAGTLAKLTKKKRSRKGVPMARSASYSRAKELGFHEHEAASYEYRQSFAKYRGISLAQKITGSIASSRSSHSVSINATFERQSNNRDIGGKFHAGPSKVTNGYLVTIHNYLIAVDELVNKFRCLSIDSSDRIIVQEQNAMVLFGKVDTMVPYVGPFDPIKRRKPRAKVDLDPETDRVWRSLMGKECRLSIEGTGEDKEKWWEEERRIFRGRADSFIARMHLVQGDRRFTQWKGSVVDSVIGVFLTQNVSDHLSSSAFMSLAARFPLQSTSNHRAYYEQRPEIIVEEPESGIADADDSRQWHEKMSTEAVCDQGYITLDEVEHIAEREVAECIESLGSNKGGCRTPDNSKGKQSAFCKSGLDNLTTETEKSCSVDSEDRRAVQDVVSSQNSVGSSENSACSSILQTSDRSLTLTRISTCLVEARNSTALEDVVSSQNCDTSIIQTAERSCSDSNSEAEDVMTGCKSNSYDCSTSFTRLLHMAGTSKLQEYYSHGQESFSPEKKLDCGSTQSESTGSERSSLEGLDCLKDSFNSIYPSKSKLHHQGLVIPSNNYHLQKTPDLGRLEVRCLEVSAEQRTLSSISTASEITDRKGMDSVNEQNCLMEETVSETTVLSVQAADLVTSLSKHSVQILCSSGQKAELEKHSHSCNNFEVEQPGILQPESTLSKEPQNLVEELAPRRSNELQQGSSSFPEFPIENLHVEETVCLVTEKTHTDNKDMASNLEERVLPSDKACSETAVNTLKVNGKPGKENKTEFDWDSLRKDAYLKSTKKERTRSTMDTLDYEALRCAKVSEIAESIKERGMNNMLAERIKDFLNRLVRDHESIDLEWLKDVPPDKAKEYLLSIRGLGLKSVECVRLLTLHQLAFPVDVNVGRIAVRLGWVPLQPLPESLQLHLLELYPMQETIQKYLWPRLCTLDQRTLYELHYQMITFGKVFCTKSKPNCNACPLRAECKHFASAFASARLALPAPEEKGMVPSTAPIVADKCPSVNIRPMQITLPERKIVSESSSNECEPIIEEPEITLVSETISGTNECKPIIEEPASPEIRTIRITEREMEDAFNEDPDEIPTINVSMTEFTTTVTNYLQENNMELQVDDMSKALIALTPEAASIPMPKLKNVGRLRTEHEVYVIPDTHPLLEGLDRREPDDPSSYLLAIWTPGETPESTEPPKICCGSHESGNLCNEKTCFPCNSFRETKSQIVRGTILIPCKTAMRGSFPLNGTYFQVNEVFADHDSSQCPINVPRKWLWDLPRRTVFFGTSVISIFKGLSTEVIQSCFWRGFVCVRGFDRTTRSPRPLKSRLHYTATRLKQEEEARKKQ